MRASATGLEPFIFRLKGSHSKIGNLQGQVVVEQQILRLEVPVAYPERVKVMEAVDELLEEEGCLVRLEKSLRIDVVEQFSLRDVF
jgi:hypothetical protein